MLSGLTENQALFLSVIDVVYSICFSLLKFLLAWPYIKSPPLYVAPHCTLL